LLTGIGAVAVVVLVTNSSGLRGGAAAGLALVSAVTWWIIFARAARRHKAFQLATRDMQSYLDTTVNPRHVKRGLRWGYVTRPRHAGEVYSTYVNMCLGYMIERARFTVNVNHAYGSDGRLLGIPADSSSSGEDSPRHSAGNVSAMTLPPALATRRQSVAPPPPPPPRRASVAPPGGMADTAVDGHSSLSSAAAAAVRPATVSVASATGATVTITLPMPALAVLPPSTLHSGCANGTMVVNNPMAFSQAGM